VAGDPRGRRSWGVGRRLGSNGKERKTE
jgi:hypothetical protein